MVKTQGIVFGTTLAASYIHHLSIITQLPLYPGHLMDNFLLLDHSILSGFVIKLDGATLLKSQLQGVFLTWHGQVMAHRLLEPVEMDM